MAKSAGASNIKSFFKAKCDDYSTINAEVMFTEFLVEHNCPLSVSDHASKLFKKMFPDSKIAEQYGCARTKLQQLSIV